MATDIQNAQRGDDPTLVIEPEKGWVRLELRELWQYRELLYFLTWRNILVRYKQAVLGVLWAVLNPVITMVVFTIVFNKLLGVDSGSYGVPYAVFTFTGLLPWNLFAAVPLGRGQRAWWATPTSSPRSTSRASSSPRARSWGRCRTSSSASSCWWC